MKDLKNLSQADREFSIVEDGVTRLFIYDPDLMNFKQIADANTKLQIYESIIKMLPATMNEYQEAVKREALSRGLAALLVEVNPENKAPLYEKYNMNEHTGMDLLEVKKGLTGYQRLEVCKLNFFILQGHIPIDSIKQLTDTMKELESEGISRELQSEMMKAALQKSMSALKLPELNSIQEPTEGKPFKKKPTTVTFRGKSQGIGNSRKKK